MGMMISRFNAVMLSEAKHLKKADSSLCSG